LRLIWHKRRWRCKERLCPRASFTESLPAVRKGSRLTTRLRTELGYAIAEPGRTVAESAAHYGVDWSIVHTAFAAHVRAPLAAPLPPVSVLGIDETPRHTDLGPGPGHEALWGWPPTGGTPGSSTPPAPAAFWPRSKVVPVPPPSPG